MSNVRVVSYVTRYRAVHNRRTTGPLCLLVHLTPWKCHESLTRLSLCVLACCLLDLQSSNLLSAQAALLYIGFRHGTPKRDCNLMTPRAGR